VTSDLNLIDPDGERLEVWNHPGDTTLHLVAIARPYASGGPSERVGYYLTEANAHKLRDVINARFPEDAEPAPDYAAMAAEFKPGDLALVSDNPGTNADGSGFVDDAFRGRAVNVAGAGIVPEVVKVALGNGISNYIHVAHLTKAKAVPA
jgi:hypothetical protein